MCFFKLSTKRPQIAGTLQARNLQNKRQLVSLDLKHIVWHLRHLSCNISICPHRCLLYRVESMLPAWATLRMVDETKSLKDQVTIIRHIHGLIGRFPAQLSFQANLKRECQLCLSGEVSAVKSGCFQMFKVLLFGVCAPWLEALAARSRSKSASLQLRY